MLLLVVQVSFDPRTGGFGVHAQRQASSTDLRLIGITLHVAFGGWLHVATAERGAAEALRAILRAGDVETLLIAICHTAAC